MSANYMPQTRTLEYARALGIDAITDVATASQHIAPSTGVKPGLVLNAEGQPLTHVTDEADYESAQIDYYFEHHDGIDVLNYRAIARIPAGSRTELAFWTMAAPAQEINIHKGIGHLVIGNPVTDTTNTYKLDGEVTKTVVLQPGRFYTFSADQNASEPLVVSGFYPEGFDWERAETPMLPGQLTVDVHGGWLVDVPSGFRELE